MAQKTIEIPGIGTVLLVKRRGSRNIRLSFTREGQVRISLPYFVPFSSGVEFARSRQDWIDKHRPEESLQLQHGDRIGKAHRLSITTSEAALSPRVQVRRNIITVSCPVEMPINHIKVQAAAERGALKALKAEADQLLPQRLRQLAAKHDFKYSSVTTKRLSSRWGSCSQLKEIILNTYLMQLPWELIDYVIIHELVHTEHLNHSLEFWTRFEEVLPDAKKIRKILKNHKTIVTPIGP